MRRLAFLLVALGIALYAFHLLATTTPLATYALRDGLLLATCAALIFAWNSPSAPLSTQHSFAVRHHIFYLTFITLLALLLRTWQLTSLPPDCLASECDQALILGSSLGRISATTLFPWLAQHLLPWTGSEAANGLLALRLTSALLGTLTIIACYLAAQQLALDVDRAAAHPLNDAGLVEVHP